jgi:hypothetical protein
MLTGLIGAIILAISIVAIYDVLTRGGSLGRKVLWIVLILIFPILGVILYFLLGRK